jgi:two-component system, LuxR family, response regulator FixJ
MGDRHLVVIIDDDADVRDALGAMIHREGFDPRCFETATRFIAEGLDLPFAVIISDYQMPEMNGLDLRRELSARGIAAPLILITAFATTAIHSLARRYGVHALLEKPFEPSKLLDEVRAAIAS